MHCQNCANAVCGAINDVEGAAAKVSCDREIEAFVIEEAIRKRGCSFAFAAAD